MRISSGPASHCVRNQDNQALSGGSDRKALGKAVRTSATMMEGRGTGESFPHFSAQPPDKISTSRQPVLCDKTWDSLLLVLPSSCARKHSHQRLIQVMPPGIRTSTMTDRLPDGSSRESRTLKSKLGGPP